MITFRLASPTPYVPIDKWRLFVGCHGGRIPTHREAATVVFSSQGAPTRAAVACLGAAHRAHSWRHRDSRAGRCPVRQVMAQNDKTGGIYSIGKRHLEEM